MRREERGGEEGDALMDGCMSHTLSPPLRGEERVWGSPNLPTAASPLLKRGVDDGGGVIAVGEP